MSPTSSAGLELMTQTLKTIYFVMLHRPQGMLVPNNAVGKHLDCYEGYATDE